MNLYIKTLKNLISSTLTVFILASCFTGAMAARSNDVINGYSSKGSPMLAPNPDAGFTVTENTTIDQSINLWGNILVKSGYTLM